ncbi:hypothetical protein BLNAU_5048 [Blattamonas nauphoetae]|uniref:Uncharacterized protein n=1 Tax=Blattamonas nauphoetae TaxID=2049346 RepID=A0ABQ9Y7Y3_9EUKA|nr:hypothetical protein BLNAU_5048 [Blattamonas nauphoetae]
MVFLLGYTVDGHSLDSSIANITPVCISNETQEHPAKGAKRTTEFHHDLDCISLQPHPRTAPSVPPVGQAELDDVDT